MKPTRFINRKGTRHIAALSVLASAGLASSASANAVQTAQAMYWRPASVTAQCIAGLAQGNGWETATDLWRGALANHGVTVGPKDLTIFWSEVTDAAHGGQDGINSNLDTADIGLIASHGFGTRTPAHCYNGRAGEGLDCDYTRWGVMLTSSSGNPSNGCSASSTDMTMGNNQLEYVDVFACESMEKRGAKYTIPVMRGLHQWHGFAGIMNTAVAGGMDDYIDDAFDGPASWAWVSNMSNPTLWGASSGVCATSLVRGTSTSDANTRAAQENYAAGSKSFSDPTSGNYWWFQYYTQCDPPSPLPGPMGNWPW